MDPPEGYEVKPGYVCKLKKSLYGLKQASRQWNQKFTEKMEVFGFVQSKNDYCLFMKEVSGGQIALLVYVDDIFSHSSIRILYSRSEGKTKKQATVSKSTAEAEYRSLASTVCELTWIGYLLQDLGISLQKPIPLFCDNKAAVHITANPVFHECTKHLEIDCHIVRDKFKEGYVIPTHLSAKEQIADILTKLLTGPAFQFLKSKLNLYSLPPSLTCVGDVKMGENAETELVEGVT
ncbi:Retrovirus-related Pol polyprotein from transposon TNT 1-94 [Sesamum angolense]|uniref:Retrovirus-related Pol polyprotein from transposon TNT 1-94 n=1 Tax=Sesamum angolense TaxID=2727404 RepID=A0AAE1T5F0_9LAMI|nr:Retrovirus-related Pol polyprotein from transposon TNT 1-94 [Sesamum angolense]